MTEEKFITNEYGVRINKCCASCANKRYDKGAMRICMAGFGTVTKDFRCSTWKMAPGLSAAGSGKGKVKCKKYLDYLRIIRENGNKEQLTVSDIRNTFEKVNGSIYIV